MYTRQKSRKPTPTNPTSGSFFLSEPASFFLHLEPSHAEVKLQWEAKRISEKEKMFFSNLHFTHVLLTTCGKGVVHQSYCVVVYKSPHLLYIKGLSKKQNWCVNATIQPVTRPDMCALAVVLACTIFVLLATELLGQSWPFHFFRIRIDSKALLKNKKTRLRNGLTPWTKKTHCLGSNLEPVSKFHWLGIRRSCRFTWNCRVFFQTYPKGPKQKVLSFLLKQSSQTSLRSIGMRLRLQSASWPLCSFVATTAGKSWGICSHFVHYWFPSLEKACKLDMFQDDSRT